MMIDEVLDDRVADGRREIHILNSEITCARVVFARLESRPGQLDKRDVLPHCDCICNRSHRSNQRTSFAFSAKGQRRFNLSILRKVFRVGEIESTACRIKSKLTLLIALESSWDAVNVAQIEVSGVN